MMKIKQVLLLILVAIILAMFLSDVSRLVVAGVDSPNVTVGTKMSIRNVEPEVLNVSINDGNPITLIPNSTKKVSCIAIVADYDGDVDISSVNATFYDPQVSFDKDTDDNNYHYTNSSCSVNLSYGTYNGYADDSYRALANCTFDVWYYADAAQWTCNVSVFDLSGGSGRGVGNENISQLLALGLPDSIDYGVVNATSVSEENQTNVTNYGNVIINLSLEGYAVTQGDGYAMNCTYGSVQNISVQYEKYNLTNSNPGTLNLTQFEANYTNLTSSAVVKFFNLTVRQNDTQNEISKPTYWRIYLPKGVAGNCTGHIVFGATTASGS